MLFELQRKGGGRTLIKVAQINCRQNCGRLGGVKLVKKVNMFAMSAAQLCFILFYLLYFGLNSFSILMLLKTGVEVYI